MNESLVQSLPTGVESAKPNPGLGSGSGQVVVVFNARSGKGRAADAVRRFTSALDRVSFGSRTIGLDEALRDPDAFRDAAAIIVAGGDGTVRAVAPRGIASGTPIYHLPMGTENLFAREFGMTRDPKTVLDSLRHARVARVDAGELDGVPFILMAGFGPDADVVARLQARRRGAISHLSYAIPILQTLARPRFPRLVVRADGRTLVDGVPGLLVIANSRQYGARLDPAPMASMHDGLLDAVFMPCASRTRSLAWAAACRLGAHARRRGYIHAPAASFEIQCLDGPLSIQVDGEPGPRERERVQIIARAGVLPVLIPPTG